MRHGVTDDGLEMLYQVICLQNMPPETLREQEQCMHARAECWRLKAARKTRKTA